MILSNQKYYTRVNRMKYLIRLKITFFVLVLSHLMFPQAAYAYLDPGTGSYIFQLIIAVLIGGLFAVKLFWNKIKLFFKNLFSRGKTWKS